MFLITQTDQSMESIQRILWKKEVDFLKSKFFAENVVTQKTFETFYNFFANILIQLKNNNFLLNCFKKG